MRKIFVLSTLIAVSGFAVAAPSGGRPTNVFQCSFGKKQVLVTRAGPLYLYSFGLPGKPEVQIVGDPSKRNIFSSENFGTLDGGKQLRLANGRYSYVVFFNGLSKDYGTLHATSASGLAVFDGKNRISKFSCKSGMGFTSGWNADGASAEELDDYDVS